MVLVLEILIILDSSGVVKANQECKAKIKSHFPDAECAEVRAKKECKTTCEKMGEEKCQGNRGEIRKLNCKRTDGEDDSGPVMCCCSISCEGSEETRQRLDEALTQDSIMQDSYTCVEALKSEIKDELKKVCRTEPRVQAARKYCLEKFHGRYYCLKDGKCFGNRCKGCIKHECEVNGKKQILNPPEEYMEKTIQSSDLRSGGGAAINVEDMDNVEHMRKWCTMLRNRTQCKAVCEEFGNRLCHGAAIQSGAFDECKRGAEDCECCCHPTCDKNKSPTAGTGEETGGELPPEAETTTAGIDNQEGFEEDIADNTTPNADIESYGEQEEGSESEAPGETTTIGPDDLTTTKGSDNETENPEDHGEDEEYEEYGDDAEYEENGGHDAGDTEYSDEEYVEPGEDSPVAGSSEDDPDVQEYSEEVYEEYEEPPSDEKVVSGKADAVESDYYNMPNYLEEYHEPEF